MTADVEIHPLIRTAIDAAARQDTSAFSHAMREVALSDALTAEQRTALQHAFLTAVSARIGHRPAVAELGWLAQELDARVAPVAGVTRFEIEFLLRGLAGADSLLAQISPQSEALVEIVCLGAIDGVPARHVAASA